MSDFTYLKSAKTYVRNGDVSQVTPVFNGQIVTGYDLNVNGVAVNADAGIDGSLIHSDILGIPQDINHP